MKKLLFFFYFLVFCFCCCNAQIEVAHVSAKSYSAIGFGGFLNFSIPASEANYITLEAGVQYFKDKNTDEMALIPFLAGFRYTLDQSGSGWYIEPFAGYTIGVADDFDDFQGVTAGASLGYLVDLGNVPFNFSVRYEHVFAYPSPDVISIRIAHSFSIGRRNDQ